MVRKLATCVRQYTLPSLLAPLFMLLEVATEINIPFFMADLIDNGIYQGDIGYICRLGGILTVVAFVAMLFGMLSGIYGARASAGFAHNLRHDMFHNIQRFSFANIDKFSPSSLITRLTTDVANVQNAYLMIIRMAVRAPIMLILALVMSFRVNADISLIFLGAIPLLALGLFLIVRNVFPIFERVFKTYDRLNKIVQENLRGIRVVKAFVQENAEINKFNKVSDDIYADFSRAEKIISYNMPLMQFCMYACMILAAWIGAKLIVGSTMSTGQLMSVITYATQILMSLMMVSMVFVMIIISKASAERITEVLYETSDLTNCNNPTKTVKDGSITFENVNFSYTNDMDKLCLRDISLHISSGETVGIIGSTGSSKTSLVQLIPRLYDATSGCVMVGGIDVRKYDIEALRNDVAVVLQKNTLFSGTIRENLRWGNEDASDDELIRVCKLAQAHQFIISFEKGYDSLVEQGGSNLSGGQRQRLCIARALLKKPKILILDDSTSAVDTKTEAFLRKALMEEIPNTTKLIIAQRISSVRNADRIVVMEDGLINAVGTHEQLLKDNSIYIEVFNSQLKGADFDESN